MATADEFDDPARRRTPTRSSRGRPRRRAGGPRPLRPPVMGPLALVAIVAFFGVLLPDTFLTRTNLVTNVLEVVAFLVIVAAGQTVVMVVGDFDLSVGGVAALSTAVTASFIATTTLDGQPQTARVGVLVGRPRPRHRRRLRAAQRRARRLPRRARVHRHARHGAGVTRASPATASTASRCSGSSRTTSSTSPAATCSVSPTRSGSR